MRYNPASEYEIPRPLEVSIVAKTLLEVIGSVDFSRITDPIMGSVRVLNEIINQSINLPERL